MFRIATWNVNSLRVRLPHVLAWLDAEQPDVLALQETKLQDPDFPRDTFAERGYHGVSMDDIGSAAGVTGPALYHHFRGKEAMLAAALTPVSQGLLTGGRERVAAHRGDARAALESLVDFHVEFALAHPAVIALHLHELDRLPDDYLRIDSGSGSALPRHLLILPVLLRDRLIGVLEFAGFAAPTALQRQLLEQLLPTVALSLDNLGRAVRTQDLLEQTQEQADQLRVSSITMRQQQEALRESHDILQAKTLELEEQSQRLLVS